MATLVHDPARNDLCEVVETNGWLSGRERDIGDVHYSFEAKSSFSAASPGESKEHSVWINGTTRGVAIGLKAPPVLYDPSEAEIEIAGKKIKALPQLWKSELGDDSLSEIRVPANMNVKGKIISPSFRIIFPIEINNPKAEYIFRPGTILLDGVRYPLPVYRSCYTPSKWRWSPIH